MTVTTANTERERVHSLISPVIFIAFLESCYGLNMFVSPNSYVEILTVKDDGMGSGAFDKYLCHEGGVFMHGISAFQKRAL